MQGSEAGVIMNLDRLTLRNCCDRVTGLACKVKWLCCLKCLQVVNPLKGDLERKNQCSAVNVSAS